jgi:hypothetical protein
MLLFLALDQEAVVDQDDITQCSRKAIQKYRLGVSSTNDIGCISSVK